MSTVLCISISDKATKATALIGPSLTTAFLELLEIWQELLSNLVADTIEYVLGHRMLIGDHMLVLTDQAAN